MNMQLLSGYREKGGGRPDRRRFTRHKGPAIREVLEPEL